MLTAKFVFLVTSLLVPVLAISQWLLASPGSVLPLGSASPALYGSASPALYGSASPALY